MLQAVFPSKPVEPYFRDPVLRFWVAHVVRGVEVSLTAEPLDLAA